MNLGGWENLRDGAEIHVVPLNDVSPHRPRVTCWCQPQRDEKEPLVVVHFAKDGREQFENRERRPS